MMLGIALAMSAAGCTAAPEPSRSTPPTPSAAAEPTPSPTASASADSIVVSLEGFDVVAESGEILFSHVWADEVPAAVDELTEIFEAEPTMSERAGNSHNPPYRVYSWPGFELSDAVSDRERTEDPLASVVHVTAAEVNGIEITTDSGFRIGTTFDELEAAGLEEMEFPDGESDFWLDQVGDCCVYMLASGPSSTRELTSISSPMISF